MYRVLIIDDNKLLLESLEIYLSTTGYEIVTTSSAVDGLLKCSEEDWDLVLVDFYMEDMNGDTFLKLVNKLGKRTKVAIFSANANEEIELDAFNNHAVDFIHKTENPEILVKRLEKILEGSNGANAKLVSVKESLVMDLEYRIVTINDVDVELSNTEFDILKVLLENKNKVLSRDFIHGEVWMAKNKYLDETRVIDVHVLNLRRKLNVDSITTRKGIGYVWKEDS